MKSKITTIDEYFSIGCGRCDKGNTPDCKVHTWAAELAALRNIALNAGLVEELKWSQPTYTLNGGNVIMVSALKDGAFISFLRGSLLTDPENILQKPGANSNIARVIRFKNVSDIKELEPIITKYIEEAVKLVKDGKKVDVTPKELTLPVELTNRMEEDASLKEAFLALTPGRQRSHVLHISSAKQAATRVNRVEKCIPKIYDGLGFNEYKK
jgi:uncharacterized protein YdeI (YjbR/CyaY-like superfamily)